MFFPSPNDRPRRSCTSLSRRGRRYLLREYSHDASLPEPISGALRGGPPRFGGSTSATGTGRLLRTDRSSPASLSRIEGFLNSDAEGEDTLEKQIGDAVDRLPLDLARVVVNMQEHYESELKAEWQKTGHLLVENAIMKQRLDEMEKRIEMHVVIMDGFVGFMRDVEGKFAVGERTMPAELEIAKHLGREHAEEIEAIASGARPRARVVHPSVERPHLDEQTRSSHHEVPQEAEKLPLEDAAGQTIPQCDNTVDGPFDQLPPTPDMETTPVRSTGRRAPRRRNPPVRTTRQVNPHAMSSQKETGSGGARPCAVMNTTESDHDTPPLSIPDLHLETIPEEERGNGDSPHDPIIIDDDTEVGDTTIAASPSPSSSFPADSPPPTEDSLPKPRYAVPRSQAFRNATGPPGRPYKYYRLPKTVALVWEDWKHGLNGNPAIHDLERRYGNLWRLGTLQERRYASNYVGIRQRIVRQVEHMCEEGGMAPEEACRRLDERVDGRMHLLMTVLRKRQDPFEVILKRKKTNFHV
ncbi:hypothetical protein ACHAPT_011130 [Fusarium lateritium]